MSKKRAISDNAGSSSESSQMAKKSRKEQGRAIRGNPDAWDFKNITVLVDSYEKAYPGRIKRMSTDARTEYALSGRNKFGVVAGQSDTRLMMWMPGDLMEALERVYPSIWTNKKHLIWFLKNFPTFRAVEKI